MPAASLRRSTRVSRVLLITIGAAVTASIVGVGVVAAVAAIGSGPGASVDGVRFTDDELSAAKVRAERAGAPDPDSLSAAVDVLRDDLALFAVARSVGASDVERPQDITAVLPEANRERAASSASGEVLYGPVQYDERSFYGKAITDIRQAVLARLDDGAGGVVVTDGDIRARFDAEPSLWSDAATTYEVSEVTGSGPAPADGDWNSLRAAGAVQQRTYSADDLESGTVNPDLAAALAAAADGDVLGPMTTSTGWTALHLDSRTVDLDRAFEHYRSRIRAVLVEEHLESLLNHARSAQNVHLP